MNRPDETHLVILCGVYAFGQLGIAIVSEILFEQQREYSFEPAYYNIAPQNTPTQWIHFLVAGTSTSGDSADISIPIV
jgi:hypothetical protein